MRSASVVRRAAGLAFAAACTAPVVAYPEYQAWSQQNSGRGVNCALCHAHPDGPEGIKPGQMGSLDTMRLQALADARLAFEPGTEVHSPILNEFGNDIVRQLGRTEFISLRTHPDQLVGKLDPAGDLDSDGVSDVREYSEGTDPLDAQSGPPGTLFAHNLDRQRFHIVMIVLATACGLYGLNNLLKGLHSITSRRRPGTTGAKTFKGHLRD